MLQLKRILMKVFIIVMCFVKKFKRVIGLGSAARKVLTEYSTFSMTFKKMQ